MQVAIVTMPQESPDDLVRSGQSACFRVGTKNRGRTEDVWLQLSKAIRGSNGAWRVAGSIDHKKEVPDALKGSTTFEAKVNVKTGMGNLEV